MDNDTITLTIIVLSHNGEPHYKVVKFYCTILEVDGYIALLRFLGYNYSTEKVGKTFTITIPEPNLKPAKLIIYNNKYLSDFSISETDSVHPPIQMGDPMFWDSYAKADFAFIKKIWSKSSNPELEKFYDFSEAKMARELFRIIDIARPKYPNEQMKNRKQFTAFAVKIGVFVEVKCKNCGQIM